MMSDPATSALLAFIDFTLKGFLILLLAVVADRIFSRANASLRHLIWSIALAAVLLLPFTSAVVPQLQVPLLNSLLMQGDVGNPGISGGELPAGFSGGSFLTASNLFALIFGVYIVGAVSVFFWQLIGQVYARRIRAAAHPVESLALEEMMADLRSELGVLQNVRLLESKLAVSPFSVGIMRPAIVLPEGAHRWPLLVVKAVLIHELAHIERKDLLSRALGQLSCSVNWFNPLAWFGLKKLLIEQEIACDDRVLTAGSKPSDYAQSLLVLANVRQGRLDFAMAAIGRNKELKDRLLEILTPRRSKNPLTGQLSLAFLFIVLMFLLPVFLVNLWNDESTVSASPPSPIIEKEKSSDKALSDEELKLKEKKAIEAEKRAKDEAVVETPQDVKITEEMVNEKLKSMKAKGASDAEIKKFLNETKKKMEAQGSHTKKVKIASPDEPDKVAEKAALEKKKKEEQQKKKVKDKSQ